ncbi:hypothetical protein PHMEG_00017658 [Phytophthora megakarya]|uniref:Uncharacterized protein n=1 Tax=Phytophthora megakarya TaxID=4795 RepID=A0A225VW99_9STRA|nr:hypothetical protein PHMEG_00017658 [Phytophthora megakarya]
MGVGVQCTHKGENYSQNVVDQTSVVCTNRIDSIWVVKIKTPVKCELGMMETKAPRFLDE